VQRLLHEVAVVADGDVAAGGELERRVDWVVLATAFDIVW
jgi:hypothetical protein